MKTQVITSPFARACANRLRVLADQELARTDKVSVEVIISNGTRYVRITDARSTVEILDGSPALLRSPADVIRDFLDFQVRELEKSITRDILISRGLAALTPEVPEGIMAED